MHGKRTKCTVESYSVMQCLDDYAAEHEVVAWRRLQAIIRNLAVGFGDAAVQDLSIKDSRDYAAKRRMSGIKDGTIRRELGVLVAAINHAVMWRRIRRDFVPFIELPPSPPPRNRWLTREEMHALLNAAASFDKEGRMSRASRFIILAYNLASRRAAIESLKWSQVDLENRVIYLNPEGRRQTSKNRPPLPISDALFPIVSEMFRQRIGDFVLDNPGRVDSVFNAAVARAGIKKISPHVLRHTRAVHLAQAGVPLYAVSGFLGDTIATVEKNYLHHSPTHLREALNAACL